MSGYEYSEEDKINYVEEFKNSKMFPFEFAKAKGILISDFKKWLREYPSGNQKLLWELKKVLE